jgi:hypothetical protein
MSSPGSVTVWIAALKAGNPQAAQCLWEDCFQKLLRLARKKLRGRPASSAGAEDVALGAFDSEAARQVSIPDDPEGMVRCGEGPAGMQSLLLLVRDEPLPAEREAELRSALQGLERQAAPGLRAAAWFENGELVTDERERSAAPEFTKVEKGADPVLRTQALLRTRLKEWFPYTRAVCFS